MRYYLTITTRSELCVSDGGEGWDASCAVDVWGFPVLRGTGLRGLLRAACGELVTLGLADAQAVQTLFGAPDRPGLLTVQDAHPANYPQLWERHASGEDYMTVRVMSSFDAQGTSSRTRMLRCVKRGLTFLCEYECPEAYAPLIVSALPLLRRMGLQRTRGIGLVSCRPADAGEVRLYAQETPEVSVDAPFLQYTLDLLSPLVLPEGREDAVPGSTLRGCILSRIGAAETLRVTDAHLSSDGRPACTAPAFLAAPKRAADRRLYVLDTPLCEACDPPALPLGGGLLAADAAFASLCRPRLQTTVLYRHEQGEPGRPAQFFRLHALSEGQRFTGRIYGDAGILRKIADSFKEDARVNLGSYRTSGAGQCRVTLRAGEEVPSFVTDTLAFWLCSPAVLLDDNGMYQCRPELFRMYADLLLPEGVHVTEELRRYVQYRTAPGGRFRMYAAGTVFVLRLNREIDTALLHGKHIGERTEEGFGELHLLPYDRLRDPQAPFTAEETADAAALCAPYLLTEAWPEEVQHADDH